MTTQLTFNNTHLNVIERDNQPFITATDLAKALGYKSDDSISRIYRRNMDEFSLDMSLTVKLTANGINNSKRQNEVRVFSLRGAHLIAMFSRSLVAKEFRKWVLDVLDRETKQVTQPKEDFQSSIDYCTNRWKNFDQNQERTLDDLWTNVTQLEKMAQNTKQLIANARVNHRNQTDLVEHIQLYHRLQNPLK